MGFSLRTSDGLHGHSDTRSLLLREDALIDRPELPWVSERRWRCFNNPVFRKMNYKI